MIASPRPRSPKPGYERAAEVEPAVPESRLRERSLLPAAARRATQSGLPVIAQTATTYATMRTSEMTVVALRRPVALLPWRRR